MISGVSANVIKYYMRTHHHNLLKAVLYILHALQYLKLSFDYFRPPYIVFCLQQKQKGHLRLSTSRQEVFQQHLKTDIPESCMLILI